LCCFASYFYRFLHSLRSVEMTVAVVDEDKKVISDKG